MRHELRDDDPRKIGAYTLDAVLGGGGMGKVYLGHSSGGHRVAVKVVRAEYADDSEFRRRFAIEVAAASKVGGLYTAQVLDADPDGDPPWMATDYVQGLSLQETVAEHGPLPAATVRRLAAGLAEGLRQVHAAQVVHRDLKPSNVILTEGGPKLLDFGIARALDATSYTRSQHFGTPGYMSPEQARAEPVDATSDVFSLGSTLVYAATGRGLFGEGNPFAMAARVARCDVDSAVLADLPESLGELIAACLHEDPDERAQPDEIIELAGPLPGGPGHWLPGDVTVSIRQEATEKLPPPRPLRPTLRAPKRRVPIVPDETVPEETVPDEAAREEPRATFTFPQERPEAWSTGSGGRVLLGVLALIAGLGVAVFVLTSEYWWAPQVTELIPAGSGIVGFVLDISLSWILPWLGGLALIGKLIGVASDLLPTGRQFDAVVVNDQHVAVSRTRTKRPDVELPWHYVRKVGLRTLPDGAEVRVWLRSSDVPEEWAKQNDVHPTGSGAYILSTLAGWHPELSRNYVDKLRDALEYCGGTKYVELTESGEPVAGLT